MNSKKISILLIIFLLVALCLPVKNVFSANVGVWNPASFATDTDMSTDLGYFCWGVPTDTATYGKILELDWATGFDLTGLTISDTAGDSEVEIYFGSTNCTGTARIAEATATAANDRDFALVTGQQLRIILEDNQTGNISFKFIPKGDTSTIVTPVAAGNYPLNAVEKITLSGQPTASVETMIYVGNLNEVNISASVDPSLALALSDTTCDLGTLSAVNIKTCNYDSTVSTNAAGGYSAYIKADGKFRSASHDILDVIGGAVTPANEEYGVSTSMASETISQTNAPCATLDNQSATEATSSIITTSDQTFASSSAPINADVATVCHAVGITPTTPAGSYAQLVTITVTGNF